MVKGGLTNEKIPYDCFTGRWARIRTRYAFDRRGRGLFINLADGDTVQSPLTVRFGLTGMGVAPAGVEQEGTGHHHVFINRAPLGEGEFGADEFIYPIPNDEAHRHFGGGQTETMLDLPSGEHTLQMVFGDHNHVPHDPPVTSDVITITVE